MARGRRTPKKPLHGPRKVRYFRGIAYPFVREGNTYMKIVKVSLSKENQEKHAHFEDDAIALHDGDFDLSQFQGLPLRRMHDRKKFGDIGVIDGAEINGNRQLEVWGQIFGDIPHGYNAIVDYDHGDLSGISIQYFNHVSEAEQAILGKTLDEVSLCDTGKAHYDSCLVTVSCSKTEETAGEAYSSSAKGDSNNYNFNIKRGWTKMAETNSANNNANDNNQSMAQNTGSGAQADNASQQGNNPLGDNQLGQLIENLQAQLSTESKTREEAQSKLTENEKMVQEMQKQLKAYQDKEKKEIEARNQEILKDLPDVMGTLSKLAGVDGPDKLSPKVLKLMETAWVDPELQQFHEMTKKAAQEISALRKEKQVWEAQRRQLGLQVNSATVGVSASKARFLLDNMREQARKEKLREQKNLSFDDVYTSENKEAGDNPLGPQYNGLFSAPKYGDWGSTMSYSNNFGQGGSGAPIVNPTGLTPSRKFTGPNSTMVPVSASAPVVENTQTPPQQLNYQPRQDNRFRGSVNRFANGKEDFNAALTMSFHQSKQLCPVTVYKGDAPVSNGDRF